jgi:hypothetical protein
MIVSKADYDADATSATTMGLLETGGVTNDQVYVITEGLLAGLDTSTATVGDPVWLGDAGAILFGVANKPVAPKHLVYLGTVTRVSSTVGEIFVKVQNGYELGELHDVLLEADVNITDNEVLAWDSGTSLWKNQTASEANLIPSTIVDAKGDLIVATANDTPARLAVGATNGHVLTVDSAEATGLKWAAAAAGGGDTPYVKQSTNRRFTNWASSQTNRSTVSTNTDFNLMPIYIKGTHTFNEIGVRSTSATWTGTALIRLGIYEDDGTGQPGNLVVDAGQVTITAANQNGVATISETLTEGVYWIGGVVQQTTTAGSVHGCPATTAGSIGLSMVGLPFADGSVVWSGFKHDTGVTGALPDPFIPNLASSASIITWLRRQV